MKSIQEANVKLLVYLRDNDGYLKQVSILDFINNSFGKDPWYHPTGFLQNMKQEGLIDFWISYKPHSDDLESVSAKITTNGLVLIENYKASKKIDKNLLINLGLLIATIVFGYLTYHSDTKNHNLETQIYSLKARMRKDSLLLLQYKHPANNNVLETHAKALKKSKTIPMQGK